MAYSLGLWERKLLHNQYESASPPHFPQATQAAGLGVQVFPEGTCLWGWGLCSVRGRPSSSCGEVATSLEAAVCLQLPSSCPQPHQTCQGALSAWSETSRNEGLPPSPWRQGNVSAVISGGLATPAGAKGVPEQERGSDTRKLLTHVQHGRSTTGVEVRRGRIRARKEDSGQWAKRGGRYTPAGSSQLCWPSGHGGPSRLVSRCAFANGLYWTMDSFMLGDYGQEILRKRKSAPWPGPRSGQEPKEIALRASTLSPTS